MPHLFGQKRFDALHLVIKSGVNSPLKSLELPSDLMIDFDLLTLEAGETVCQRVDLVLQCLNPCRLVDVHLVMASVAEAIFCSNRCSRAVSWPWDTAGMEAAGVDLRALCPDCHGSFLSQGSAGTSCRPLASDEMVFLDAMMLLALGATASLVSSILAIKMSPCFI